MVLRSRSGVQTSDASCDVTRFTINVWKGTQNGQIIIIKEYLEFASKTFELTQYSIPEKYIYTYEWLRLFLTVKCCHCTNIWCLLCSLFFSNKPVRANVLSSLGKLFSIFISQRALTPFFHLAPNGIRSTGSISAVHTCMDHVCTMTTICVVRVCRP